MSSSIQILMIKADNVGPEALNEIARLVAAQISPSPLEGEGRGEGRTPSLPSAPALPPMPPRPPLHSHASPPPPARGRPRTVAPPPVPTPTPPGRARVLLTSPQLPGRTLTIKEAAAIAGCQAPSISTAVSQKKPIKGYTFEKAAAGVILNYDLHGARTRGEAAGDPMPLRPGAAAPDHPSVA